MKISRLDTPPACTLVNASRPTLRLFAHDSGPVWLARPSPYGSFIHYSTPVYPGAPMILSPNSPFLLQGGGRALNQKDDRLSPTTGLAGLPCMRADGTGRAASRSFQYSRTANFRAMATFATPLMPRRNFNR